jgi:hypothetical protein
VRGATFDHGAGRGLDEVRPRSKDGLTPPAVDIDKARIEHAPILPNLFDEDVARELDLLLHGDFNECVTDIRRWRPFFFPPPSFFIYI